MYYTCSRQTYETVFYVFPDKYLMMLVKAVAQRKVTNVWRNVSRTTFYPPNRSFSMMQREYLPKNVQASTFHVNMEIYFK